MRIGPVDRASEAGDDGTKGASVKTVDDCLDILEAATQSDMWKQLPEQQRMRLVGRMSHILETAELKELKE